MAAPGGRWFGPWLLLLACTLATCALSAEAGITSFTSDGKRKEDLAWSPDGARLACSLYHQRGRIGIALIDPATGKQQILTTDPVERSPAWSPDGTRLAFVHVTQSGTDGELDIYSMAADGSDRKQLVNTGGKSFENYPSWSPDGKRLLFTTTIDKTQEIYTADADGKNLRRITSDPSLKQCPRWSPDGASILFTSSRDGGFELYRMPAAGGEIRRLTDDSSIDVAPAWSPDGRRIAWVSNRDGNFEIYVMDADGKGPRNVSRHPGYDFSPAWRPDGMLTWVSDRSGGYDVLGTRP